MNAWWQYYPNRFKDSFCDMVVQKALMLPPVAGQIGLQGSQVINQEIRRSQVRWIPRRNHDFDFLFEALTDFAYECNKFAFGFDLTTFNDVQFTEYDASYKGHYDWHMDTNWGLTTHFQRKLSMVLQLSPTENYTGGDLEFLQDDCNILPDAQAIRQKGTIVAFPAFLKHRVTPVTSGKRYSIVTWVEGPNFR